LQLRSYCQTTSDYIRLWKNCKVDCLCGTINHGDRGQFLSPKRWSCTHFFLWSTTISFGGFMVQVGRKYKNLNIIDRTWNMNKHILKLHVMVHTNLHLNALTFWFERIVVRLKNLYTWICISSMAPWAHNKPQKSLNACIMSTKFYFLTILLVFQNQIHSAQIHAWPNAQWTSKRQTKTLSIFKMHELVCTNHRPYKYLQGL
jgi:hypothetical protein